MQCSACVTAQPNSAEFCAACGRQLARVRPGSPARQSALAITAAYAERGDWPGMFAPHGLRLRPEAPVRLTWVHAARWLLGALLTVVLLGGLFTAMRLGPGVPCSGRFPQRCIDLFTPRPNSPYTFPPGPPVLGP